MNPILHTLGFSPGDRVVILHADDIGSSHSSVAAYADLLAAGVMSSAATMVPCPWFPATAAFCRQHKDDPRLDMGVHLTLNCEWRSYRWRPLTTRDPASGLLDDEGFFPTQSLPVFQRADPAAVRAELVAQVQAALAAGIDVTHVDNHMLTLFHPRLLPVYIDVAQQFHLPPFLVHIPPAWQRNMGYGDDDIAAAQRLIDQAAEAGLPVFDFFAVLSLDEHENRLGELGALLGELPAGLSNILFHPAADTPELRAIAPDWRCRVADHQLFTSEALRDALANAGVHVIGFRALRGVMRSE